MQYSDFYELKEIGFGGYGTVYTAKYEKYSEEDDSEEDDLEEDDLEEDDLEEDDLETVVLKRFKSFDETPELFIYEVRNNW